MKIAIQLAVYNGAKYLPTLFASLKQQTRQDWKLFVLDNASDESNRHQIVEAVERAGFPIELERSEKNLGFSGAHTHLFLKTRDWSDVVQLLNDDAFLEPDYLERVVHEMENHPLCASLEGTVYRWNFEHKDDAFQGRTEIVDTLGLTMNRAFFIRDRFSGVCIPSVELPKHSFEVLGVSGCLPMYRTLAIREVRPTLELFDPNFLSYKEDTELALRLQAAGYSARIVPSAIAYHRRSYGTTSLKRPTTDASRYSLRNHWWMLIMHFRVKDIFTKPFTIPAEKVKLIYWLFRKPSHVITSFRETIAYWPNLKLERATVQKLRRTLPARRSPIARARVDIAVVTVVHHDLNEIYLQSLQAAINSTRSSVGVAIVDNASKNVDVDALVHQFLPYAWVLLREGDHGYGRSCNLGAEVFDAQYIFILNPDTNLQDPTILDRMADYADAHPDVGLLGPKLFYFDGRMQETSRRFPRWFMPFVQRTNLQHTKFGKRYADTFAMRDEDLQHIRNVDWVQGSAMFVRGSVWRQLDGFDHRFRLYFEDTDLCRRIWNIGKRVIYHPEITLQHAYHKQSGTYQSYIKNLLYVKEARWHVQSWIKYLWKWNAR